MSDPSSPSPPRRFVTREILVAIAFVALTALLWLNRSVLVLVFGAIVMSTVLRSLGHGIHRVTRLPMRWSVIVGVLLLAAVLGGLGWLFGVRIADQFGQLQQQLPRALDQVRSGLARWGHGQELIDAARKGLSDHAMTNVSAIAGMLTTAVTDFILIAFGALYMALDPGLYERGLLRLLPPHQRGHVGRALGAAGEGLAKWVRAQLVLMLAVGSLTGIGLALVGVPLAFSLAIIIGLAEFIPLLGPIIGAVPGVLVAFTGGPDKALWAVLVYIGVQQLENNLMTPLVQRWAVQLPPALALFAVLAAGLTFGLIGVIFATPLALVTMILVQHLYVEDALEHGPNRNPRSDGKSAGR